MPRLRRILVLLLLSALPLGLCVWQFAYDGADPRLIFTPRTPEPGEPAALDEIVSLHVDERPLRDVLAELSTRHNVSIEVDDAAFQIDGIAINPHVSLHLDDVTLRSVIDLLARQTDYERLTVVDRGGGVLITTLSQWESNPGNLRTRIYRLDGLMTAAECFDEQAIAELIRESALPGTWSSEGGLGEISVLPNAVIVRQMPSVLREIESMLAALEQVQRTPDRTEPIDVDVSASAQAGRRKILAALDRPAAFDFDEASLEEVRGTLAESFGIPIAIDGNRTPPAGGAPIRRRISGVSLRSALNILLRDLDMIFEVRGDMLVFTSRRWERPLSLRVYPVADLLPKSDVLTADRLVDVLCNSITDNDWTDPAVGGMGALVVRQHENVHEQIERLLAELRHVRNPSLYPLPHRPAEMAERRIEAALAGPSSLEFHAARLEDIAREIAREHGIRVELDVPTLDGVGIEADTPGDFIGEGMSLRHSLRWMLKPLDLTYVVRDETLFITTFEEEVAEVIPRAYRVTREEENFDYDAVIEVIMTCVSPDAWGDFSGPGPIDCFNGLIIVPQTREVHHEVAALLAALEQIRSNPDSIEPIEVHVGAFDFAKAERALDAPVTADFTETPLADVAAQVRQWAGVPVRLDTRALDGIGVGADTPITFHSNGLSLRRTLDEMLRRDGLAWRLVHGALSFTTRQEAEYPPAVVLYPIRDLVSSSSRADAQARRDLVVSGIDNFILRGQEGLNHYDDVLIVIGSDDLQRTIAAFLARLRATRDQHGDWTSHFDEAVHWPMPGEETGDQP